ncbi:MAG: NAD-dependent epimerase/dehydratase family protein [Fibrobacterota bacterium]|nr:NAD-dependent epimerase/dehydratase family protein [Fibrobacterota bacterium]
MSRIALLGCGGFVGSHFLDAVLNDPDAFVEGWDWTPAKIMGHLSRPNFRFHAGDLYSQPDLEENLSRCDVVISLAAICNPSQYNTKALNVIESNFITARRIGDICARLGKWLIQFSTSEVYGQTLAHWTGSGDGSPARYEMGEEETPLLLGPIASQRWSYACAKQLLERYVYALHKEKGLDFTIIRPFNFLGPRMDFLPGREPRGMSQADGDGMPRVLACFISALLDRKPLSLVDGGTARRTFLAVEEAVEALRMMLERPGLARNQIFNIGNPANEITIRGLAELMRKTAADITGDAGFLQLPLLDVTAEEFYGEGYADSDRRMPRIDKALRLIEWQPRQGLPEILRRTLEAAFRIHGTGSAPMSVAP